MGKKQLTTMLILLVMISTCAAARAAEDRAGQAPSVIMDIKPVQTVFNTDVNGDGLPEIVDGKSLAVLVYLDEAYFKDVDKEQVVKVKVLYGGIPYYNNTATVDDIFNLAYVAVRIKPDPPRGSGVKAIRAIVDYDHQVPGLSEYGLVKTIKANVVRTRGLKVLFVPIDRPDGDNGYGRVNQADFDGLFNRSYQFLRSTYPVADSELVFDKYEGRMDGAPYKKLSVKKPASTNPSSARGRIVVTPTKKGKSTVSAGRMADSMNLARLGNELGYDRVVGVVPRTYFTYHETGSSRGGASGTTGVHIEGRNKVGRCESVLVREDTSIGSTVAHELGHSFGLNTKKRGIPEEYKSDLYHNKKASGFDAASMRPVKGPCFMDNSHSLPKTYWICEDSWKELFTAFMI